MKFWQLALLYHSSSATPLKYTDLCLFFPLPPPFPLHFVFRRGPLWWLANQRASWKKQWTQLGCVVLQHPDPGLSSIRMPVSRVCVLGCVHTRVSMNERNEIKRETARFSHCGRTVKLKRRPNAPCQKPTSSTLKNMYLTSLTCIYLNILPPSLAGSSALLGMQPDFATLCLFDLYRVKDRDS